MQVYCDLGHCEYNYNGYCDKECISLDSNGVCCSMITKIEDNSEENESED